MNDSAKSITVLVTICLIVSLLLAAINYVTTPIIEATANKSVMDSLLVVLPDAEKFTQIKDIPKDVPETVSAIYEDTAGGGYAVILQTSSQYSSEDMMISVGIGDDETIKGVSITSYNESKDFGADYPKSYIGKDSSLQGIDTVAGVTYSSTAFKNAMSDAFTAVKAIKGAK